MTVPIAPACASLGIASVSGVFMGAIALLGYEKAVELLCHETGVGDWRFRLGKGSEIEVFVRTPRRAWIAGVIIIAKEKKVSIRCHGDEQMPLKRDSTRLRLPGSDGAIITLLENDAPGTRLRRRAAGDGIKEASDTNARIYADFIWGVSVSICDAEAEVDNATVLR